MGRSFSCCVLALDLPPAPDRKPRRTPPLGSRHRMLHFVNSSRKEAPDAWSVTVTVTRPSLSSTSMRVMETTPPRSCSSSCSSQTIRPPSSVHFRRTGMPLGATSRTHVLPSRGNGSFSVLLKVPSSVCVSQSTPSFTSDAQRCVAHYAELWCLNQLPLILGTMALAAGTTNGGLVRVRNSSLSTLSMGLVNYNFQKTMKNNFPEFVEHHLGLWLLDYHSEELGEGSMRSYRNMPDLTSFVHKDVTPEFLFKQCDAYKAHRTSHTEFVCHDELAALAEQLGMMGDKFRACEKKHGQANMNELIDRGRLCREKLGQKQQQRSRHRGTASCNAGWGPRATAARLE